MPDIKPSAIAIRDELVPAILAADRAAARQARCLATILEQRAKGRLDLDTGLDEIDLALNTLVKAVGARRSFIETHHVLRDLSVKMDGEVCFGPDCPTGVPTNGASSVSPIASIAA